MGVEHQLDIESAQLILDTAPHRGVGGRAVARPGMAAAEMINARLRGYLLVGGVEAADLVSSSATESA